MRILSALLFLFIFGACATKLAIQLEHGEIASRGEDLNEVTASSRDGFYRGAFEFCRRKSESGFELTTPPTENATTSWGVTGLIKCTGKLDPSLAQQYQEKDKGSLFTTYKGPRSDRTYFRVTTRQ